MGAVRKTRRSRRSQVVGFGVNSPKLPGLTRKLSDGSDAAYRERAALLGRYGIPVKIGKKGTKLTGAAKSQITRQLKKVREFLNPDNGFKFVHANEKTIKAVRKKQSARSQQITKKGVFVYAPDGARKQSRPRVSRAGDITVSLGRTKSIFKNYRTKDFIKDIDRVYRDFKALRAEAAFISIKGHRGGSRVNGRNLYIFMRYLRDELLEDIVEDFEDETETGTFSNYVGIEYITSNWQSYAKRGSQRRKKKGRTKK